MYVHRDYALITNSLQAKVPHPSHTLYFVLDLFCTKCTIRNMKTITTTNARKQLAKIVDTVKETGEVFAIGRRNQPEVILLKFPQAYKAEFNEITNLNVVSSSFDFLEDEPDLYTLDDAKEVYV